MRNNAEERKVTGNDGSKVDKETAAMIDRAFVIEVLRKRVLLLIGLTVGYACIFALGTENANLLELVGYALFLAIMTYVPFRISFSITVGLFSRIVLGVIILFVIFFLTEGHEVITLIILLGGLIADFASAIFLRR